MTSNTKCIGFGGRLPSYGHIRPVDLKLCNSREEPKTHLQMLG